MELSEKIYCEREVLEPCRRSRDLALSIAASVMRDIGSRLAVLFFLLSGCVYASEEEAWEQRLKANLAEADIHPLYVEFLEANLRQDEVTCAYTATTSSSEHRGTRVERYSPEVGWQLLNIDGDEPSKRALAEYAEDLDEQLSQRVAPTSRIYVAAVLSSNVQIEQEDEKTVEFTFSPKLGELVHEMIDVMNWGLVIAKEGLRPIKLVMTLDEPMSPMRGVKILKFEQEFHFMKDQTTGATLIQSSHRKATVRAFLLLRVTQEEHLVYSDFDCKVTSAKAPE